MIEIINLKKEYGNVTPIKCINTVINKGDSISVVGPSGTGKSTLLRMINMLERPTSGKILVDGEDITTKNYPLNKIRQKIGMVFQSFNLFNHMTVLENVMDAPINIKREKPEKVKLKAIELLTKVGMADFQNAYPNMLSGGQKQRVAIARTLAMEPDIILFDEPTSALDPTMVGEVKSVIKNLAEQGYTMMLVTHDMEFAETVANRVFYLDEGGIYEDGPPEQIFNKPQKEKTKIFIMRLQSIECNIEKSTYDYISFNSQVEEFIYANEIPGKEANKLRAVIEELITGVILLNLKISEERCENIGAYDIKISYSRKQKSLRVFVSWGNDKGNPIHSQYKTSKDLITYYSNSIEKIDDNTIKIKIKED